jgi:hypothetical protein
MRPFSFLIKLSEFLTRALLAASFEILTGTGLVRGHEDYLVVLAERSAGRDAEEAERNNSG